MSKAFTKEDDAADDDALDALDDAPFEGKHYMTPTGVAQLQDELQQLQRVERPKIVEVVSWAAGNGDRSENGDYIYGKKRLREIDRRIRYITRRLAGAECVDPAQQQGLEQVFFGATVTYLDKAEKEQRVQLVGLDEADTSKGKISWQAPLAKALMKARIGDVVELRAPGGSESLEILDIKY